VHAPDYLEPVVGWRVWNLLEVGGEVRLSSLVYGEAWPVRHELSAVCRLGARVAMSSRQRSLPRHCAPYVQCSCGIHATRTLEQGAVYLGSGSEGRSSGAFRVLGRVLIWGSVVEGERGWRGSRAYPERVYLPAEVSEKWAFGLAAYGVPIELLDCRNDPEALRSALSRVGVDSGPRGC
jgi:hypothetical protein